MIKLSGDNAFFIAPKNRYGLSTNETFDLTEHDFTIMVRVKIDWDSMKAGTPTHEGGIVAKNGRHCGLSALKLSDNETYIKAQFWTWESREVGVEFRDVWIDVKSNSEYMDIAMIHDKKNKKMIIDVDGNQKSIDYTGEIIDYSDSWIWVGANNSLDSCAPEHRGFLFGEVESISIYNCIVNTFESEINNHLDVKTNEDLLSLPFNEEAAAVYSFTEETKTPYKIFDISMNGNHMILFDKKWMAEESLL